MRKLIGLFLLCAIVAPASAQDAETLKKLPAGPAPVLSPQPGVGVARSIQLQVRAVPVLVVPVALKQAPAKEALPLPGDR